MADALILHIETATDICSVAISDGENILALHESGAERSHATDDYNKHRQEGKVKIETCKDCEKFKVCEGIWEDYAAIHGTSELKAL